MPSLRDLVALSTYPGLTPWANMCRPSGAPAIRLTTRHFRAGLSHPAPFGAGASQQFAICCFRLLFAFAYCFCQRRTTNDCSYCTISEIVPAPTVCPPSRMAKRKPFSIATGVISSITSCTLSPGITISVPPGNSATPVTSVVRK